MKTDTIIVAGRFDDQGGRESGYVKALVRHFPSQVYVVNGGYWEDLLKIDLTKYKLICWFADVPNDKIKIVNNIKSKNPKCILVTSKQNHNYQYEPLDIIERALKTKSNLLVEFKKYNGTVSATIWDALGNVYIKESTNIESVANTLLFRIHTVQQSKRVNSEQIGEAKEIPDEFAFFNIAKECANRFHHLIHAVNTGRFVGNLSFRCGHGFPSFKKDGLIYVSRRNIDKREIGKDGFVAVDVHSEDPIRYYGDHKPSVDTPIQVRLYKIFPVKYMLHSHVYILNAPFTNQVVPCGDIREVDEICKVVTMDSFAKNKMFVVNLLGHGSLIGVIDVKQFSNLEYVARKVPEYHEEKL